MKTLGVREMRAGYGALEATLREEGEVILTHHGRPFARVLPLNAPDKPLKMPSHADLRARMKPLKTATAELISDERDER